MATVIAPAKFGTYTGETNKGQPVSTLGKDDFLKLLITELKYQNPLEPVQDKDFIAQMANFSSLEQMQNLNKAFESLAANSKEQTNILSSLIGDNQLQQAAALIGKNIEYTVGDDSGASTVLTGKVESVIRSDSGVFLNVSGQKVSLHQVTVIK